jgi:hypothetical protein
MDSPYINAGEPFPLKVLFYSRGVGAIVKMRGKKKPATEVTGFFA